MSEQLEQISVTSCPHCRGNIQLVKDGDGVILRPLLLNPKYNLGERVKWMGQEGECSGPIVNITHPENSGFVLWIDIHTGEPFPILEDEVERAS